MTTMSIKTFLSVANILPGDISILLRGPHGIGKSQVVRQIARELGFSDDDIIDRRLSQLSEGDLIGLPSTDGNVTRFCPPDWVMRACRTPVCLFLDELNRGTNEVQQAAFQLVLDRELNGHKLHPQTRVFSAVNASAAYNVNEMDPALLDRFWTIDLTPTTEDWASWARSTGSVHDMIIDFIASNERWLDCPKDSEPGKVTPSRRSWERLSRALASANIVENPNDALFYPVCLGFVGTEATIAFHGFAKTIDNQVTGEEILRDYDKVKKKVLKLGQERQNILIEKVSDYITKSLKTLDERQGENLRKFMVDLPGELRVSAWSKMTQGSGTDNLELSKQVHKHCVQTILEVFGVTADAAVKALSAEPDLERKASKAKKAK